MGGSTFEARIAELAAARQTLMEAYSNLGLAQDAKRVLAEADQTKATAEKALADAKAQHDAVLVKANNEAQQIMHAAKVKADEARKAAFSEAAAAKAQAEQKLKAAEVAQAKALAEMDAAVKLKEEAAVLAAKLSSETEAAKAAAAKHEQAAADLKATRDKVVAALSLI